MSAQIQELTQLYNDAINSKQYDIAEGALNKIEAMKSSPKITAPVRKETPYFGQQYIEPAMAIGSSMIAEPLSGAAGLLTLPFAGNDAAVGVIDNVREKFTYQPRGDQSKENMQKIAGLLQPVVDPIVKGVNYIGDKTYEATGSPLLAAGAKTVPTAIAEYLGLKGVMSARKGVRMINPDGTPTKELTVILNNKGLSFDTLTPEAKTSIPEFAETKFFPSPKSEQGLLGDAVQKEQIISGGRDNALAPYKAAESPWLADSVNGRVVKDKDAIAAIDSGWRQGTVQMAKTSNPETKAVMNNMLDMRWGLLQNDSNASKLFPMNAVGDSFMERIKFIKDKANTARLELNDIAETQLKGAKLDPQPVVSYLQDMVKKLEITNKNPNPDGRPIYDFNGSVIQKDKSSQKVINDAVDLLATGGEPDAYRFHMLKRQLDALIDFKKKSKNGLTESGRNVLKGLRAKLNEQLRLSNKDYARVNDTLSSSLGAMDEFKSATKIDLDLLNDPTSAIGQELRKLHTNYKARNYISQAAAKVDKVANDMGGNFSTNYDDLSQFANRMDEVFGASKSGDFRGVQEAAMSYAFEGTPGLLRQGADIAKEGYKKFRGKDDYGLYQSMRGLLNK